MKTKFHYVLSLSLAVALSATQSNAQTLIQFWDFNQIRPITGGGADSLGTVFSYANTPTADSVAHTWPLTANYVATGLTAGHIIYSRPTIHYAATKDSILDGVGPGGATFFDYSSSKYTYFTSSDSGFAEGNGYLKTRNPSDSCYFYTYIPTTGYKNIQFEFAVSASSTKGATYNIFSYSANGGTTWNNLTRVMDTFSLGGGMFTPDTLLVVNTKTSTSLWDTVYINFTSDPTVNNNANFIVRFRLAGASSTGASGNDRYDNFAVLGTSLSGIDELTAQSAGYNVYPNPANNAVTIVSDRYAGAKVITLYDIVGQTVSVTENYDKQTTINTSSLNEGVYFVEIKEVSTGNSYRVKIVKN